MTYYLFQGQRAMYQPSKYYITNSHIALQLPPILLVLVKIVGKNVFFRFMLLYFICFVCCLQNNEMIKNNLC